MSNNVSIESLTKVRNGLWRATIYWNTGAYRISVPEGAFRDEYGNTNTASNIFEWYYALKDSDVGIVHFAEAVGCNPGCVDVPPACPPRVFYKPIETAGVRPMLGNVTTTVQYLGIASRAPGRTRFVPVKQVVNQFGSRYGAPGGSRTALRNSFV